MVSGFPSVVRRFSTYRCSRLFPGILFLANPAAKYDDEAPKYEPISTNAKPLLLTFRNLRSKFVKSELLAVCEMRSYVK